MGTYCRTHGCLKAECEPFWSCGECGADSASPDHVETDAVANGIPCDVLDAINDLMHLIDRSLDDPQEQP